MAWLQYASVDLARAVSECARRIPYPSCVLDLIKLPAARQNKLASMKTSRSSLQAIQLNQSIHTEVKFQTSHSKTPQTDIEKLR